MNPSRTADDEAVAGADGRVFLFLHTDNFRRDYKANRQRGVTFVREPKQEDYGTVAVFEDPYGNLWDLFEPRPAAEPVS